jgi:nicotinamide-nucleotide amidase
MRELLVHSERIAALLKERRETVAVAESAAGGLITAALLAVPGASAWCLGGIVIYTRQAWDALRDFEDRAAGGSPLGHRGECPDPRPPGPDRFQATWGIGETGAAGPTGNRYGDPAGHVCLAVSGRKESSVTLKTGKSDRLQNMHAFRAAALQLLEQNLRG